MAETRRGGASGSHQLTIGSNTMETIRGTILDVKRLNNTVNGNPMFAITLSQDGVEFVGSGCIFPVSEIERVIRTRADYGINAAIGSHMIGKRHDLTVSQPRKNTLLNNIRGV